jgi:hypothetical protein
VGRLSHHYRNFACFGTHATIVCTKALGGGAKKKKKTFIPLFISHLSILLDLILCFGVGRAIEDLLRI